MTSNRIIRNILLCAVTILVIASCSIYDEYPARRQYDIVLRLADSTGQVIPDSVAPVNTLYAFKDGIYVGKYIKEEDGKIRIAYDNRDSLTFVALSSDAANFFEMTEPKLGESINNVWLQLATERDSLACDLNAIYYGNLSTVVNGTGETEEERIITLQDIRAKVRVYARCIRPRYGDGNFKVVLQGLHSGITYGGGPGGKVVNYRLPGKFVTKDDWMTSSVTLLPTGEEPCRLLIYKQDGELIIDTTVDEKGNPLIIKPNDDIVFYVIVDYIAGITIKILPFEDIDNSYTFE